jgi:hypothetical protein
VTALRRAAHVSANLRGCICAMIALPVLMGLGLVLVVVGKGCDCPWLLVEKHQSKSKRKRSVIAGFGFC